MQPADQHGDAAERHERPARTEQASSTAPREGRAIMAPLPATLHEASRDQRGETDANGRTAGQEQAPGDVEVPLEEAVRPRWSSRCARRSG